MPSADDLLDACPLNVSEDEATLDDDVRAYVLFAAIVEGLVERELRLLVLRRLLRRWRSENEGEPL
jgi:hypothetical protein